jgi:hypothetical protein
MQDLYSDLYFTCEDEDCEHIDEYSFLSLNNMEFSTPDIVALSSTPKHPDNGSISADDGTISGRTLIPNANYFTTPPRHGQNTTGTCGPVSAQLMLSYHNYFSDRRIIDNQFLFGANTTLIERNRNPNFCEDPMSMTSFTLGSTQAFHDFIENDYISGGGTIIGVRRGMRNLLRDRNNEIAGTINFTTRYHHALGIFSIGTSGPMGEIDAGRPVILGMFSTLGGINHFVVAYGYQHRNSDFGYIVHYGWDHNGTTNHAFSWIDAR